MSDKKNLPAQIDATGKQIPTIFSEQPPKNTGGVVETWLTGFRARQKIPVHRDRAELNRAKGEELDSFAELAEKYQRTARTVAKLDELPADIELDRAERQAERNEKYENLGHQAELRKRTRQKELEDAERDVENARAQRRIAELGRENLERHKELRLRTYATRTDTERLNWLDQAEAYRDQIKKRNPSESPPDILSVLIAKRNELLEKLGEAEADGIDATDLRRQCDELRAVIAQLGGS